METTLDAVIQLVVLDADDYRAALNRCVTLDLRGPVFYDALHFQAAIKCKAEILYTNNLKDFTRLLLAEDTIQIRGVR